MNRFHAGWVVLAALLVLFASGASARDYKKQYKKIGVGVHAGYADYKGEEMKDTISGEIIDLSYDATPVYGVDATVFFADFFSVVLSADYMKPSIDITSFGTKFEAEIKQIPLLATVRVHPMRFGGFMPYAGGGVGYYYNKWSSDSEIFKDMKVDSNGGVHACAGLEWLINDHHAVNIDARYSWNCYKLSEKIVEYNAPATDEDINADALIVTVGYRYYFW